MDKTKKKTLRYLLILIVTISSTIMVVKTYLNQPIYIINQYIDAIKNENFLEAASVITYKEGNPVLNTDELAEYMQNYFSKEKLINIRKIEQVFVQNKETEYCYEVEYIFEERTSTAYLQLIKKEGAWQIIFPFKSQDVYVFAPLGSQVFLDNKKVTSIKENVYKVPYVLEGEHKVKVDYPVKVEGSTSYVIDVPEVKEVNIEYVPHQVVVEVAGGMTVELVGVEKESRKGEVIFDNVMAGDYVLKIYDKAGNIIPIEKNILVSKEKESIKVDTLQLSGQGHSRIKNYMTNFYKEYLEGIQKADNSFLAKYVQLENTSNLEKLFDEWFIQNKQVQEAGMEIELGDITLTQDGKIQLEVFENVKLLNQEGDRANKVEYQVSLNWLTTLVWDTETYAIEDRVIDQSIIAYKDKDGNWIQY